MRISNFLIAAVFAGCAVTGTSPLNPEANRSKILFMKNDLKQLSHKSGAAVGHLMERANAIAEMNDKCGSIDLTQAIDESCQNFYTVTLPEFEKEYSQVTGDIRIGSLSLGSELKDRINNINACADALSAFYVPYSDLLKVDGKITDIVPLDETGRKFKVSYDFNLGYNRNTLSRLREMGASWREQCGKPIMDMTNRGYTDLFLSKLRSLNSRMEEAGRNVYAVPEIRKTLSYGTYVSLVFYLKSKNYGAYLMNGRKLFDASVASDKRLAFMQIFIGEVQRDGFDWIDNVVMGGENCGTCFNYDVIHGLDENIRGVEKFSGDGSIDAGWVWR